MAGAAARPPLVALLTAHVQSTVNGLVRESGAPGASLGGLMFVVSLFAFLPPTLCCIGFGVLLGRNLPDPSQRETAVLWLASIHAFAVLGFGVGGGLSQKLRFTWDTFRVFPVPPAQILLAEVLAGALDLMPLLTLFSFAGLGVGLVWARPAVAPVVLLIVLQGVVWMLLVQHLVGTLLRATWKRLDPVLVLGGLVAAIGALASFVAYGLGPEQRAEARRTIGAALATLVSALPSTQGYRGLADLAGGDVAAGLLRQIVPLVSTGLLFVLVVLLHQQEGRLEKRLSTAPGHTPKLWTFGAPRTGVARLFSGQLIDGSMGRILLFLPFGLSIMLACAILLRERGAPRPGDPILTFLKGLPNDFPWLVVFVAILPFLDTEVLFNQFGWDRQGIRTLLALPIPTKELVAGKLLGLVRYVSAQAALCSLPVLWVHRVRGPEALCAGALLLASVLVFGGLGLAFSARFPRSVKGSGDAASGGIPALLLFVPNLAMLGFVWLVIAIHRRLAPLSPWGPALGMVGLLAAALAITFAALPWQERVVAACRERLVTYLS